MTIVCIIAVFAGAAILLISMIKYYRLLLRFRAEAREKRLFSRWTYGFCMLLMLFFLLGYAALGAYYLLGPEIESSAYLVASIFFFGAVFVYVVVTVQAQMSAVITKKTDELVRTLVNAMEAKDEYTRGHSVHVANLARIFYTKLPEKWKKKINLNQLLDAAILHDIGKIGIADQVLNQPGKLDEAQWKLIRQHPKMGKQILEQTSFRELSDMILYHHERMDRQGYYKIPQETIPIESRIISIVDTYSALVTDRVYRPRHSYAQAMEIIRAEAGKQFDEELVDIFCRIPEEELDEALENIVFKGGAEK